MADQKITDLTADASPTDDDLLVTVNDPAGTPANRKVTVANLSAKVASDVVASGTALTGLAGPGATLDSDDGVLAYEDGTPVIATPLYLSTVVDTAGAVMNTDYDAQTVLAATTNDTPAAVTIAEQRLLGRITGGNVTALTPAQIISIIDDADGTGSGLDADQLDGLEGSAYLVKALASGTADITNTGGKRIRFNGNYLSIGDMSLELFLNGSDTEPVLALATIFGTALRIGLGPGGSTAPDTYIQRGGAGVVYMSGIQVAPGGSTTTQGRVGARIEDVTTGVGNVGTGEDTLTTITLAASTLSATGQAVRARFAGTIANNANAKRIRLKFGSTTLLDTGASGIATGAALDWTGEYTIVRTGAATQKAFAELTLSNGTKFVDYTAPTETLSNALAVFCTGEATSNDDVRCEVMLVDWEGASPQ